MSARPEEGYPAGERPGLDGALQGGGAPPKDGGAPPAHGNDGFGLHATEQEAMAALSSFLYDRSYPEAHLHLGHGAPFSANPEATRQELAGLGEEVARLVGVFGLGDRVRQGRADPEEVRLYELLERAGLLRRSGDEVATRGFVVVPALGGLVLCGVPSTYHRARALGASAYLGNDSFLLSNLVPPPRGRRVLDLGAGCGLQGLFAARGAAEAVLSDVSPGALRFARLNARLNEVSHPVHFCCGDLFEPVRGETFDVIAALPPYVPVSLDSGVTAAVSGGEDGLQFIRRLCEQVDQVLAPGGELVMVAQLLADDDGPLLWRELSELNANLDVRLDVVERHPLQPYLLELAGRISSTGRDLTESLALLRSRLRPLGANAVCSVALRARRHDGGGTRALALHRSRSATKLTTFELGAGVGLMAAPGSLLGSPGGYARYLDEVSAALVSRLSPGRSLEEAVRLAWGTPKGASTEELVEQALSRLAPLVSDGLVLERGSSPAT